MGNYCCGEQRSSQQRRLKKIGVATPQTERSNTLSSDCWEFGEGKELLTTLKGRSLKLYSDDYPKIENFEIVGELGKGGQGEVFQVCFEGGNKRLSRSENLKEHGIYALKRVSKTKDVIRTKSIILGSQLLLENDCPFLMDGLFACENDKFLYELMDVADGGDLSTFLEDTIGKGDCFRKLGEQGIRLVLAGVILGLQYLHQRGYIYCDLKIDNVLIKGDGYPRLTDLELICQEKLIRSDLFQGTLTSCAPEILTQETVDKSIDLWALGVLLYTLVYREVPYEVEDIEDGSFVETAKRKDQAYGLKRKSVSKQLLSLINSLLRFNPKDRIGFSSISQIQEHQFFYGFDWNSYAAKTMKNPIADIVQKFSKKKRIAKRKTSLHDQTVPKMFADDEILGNKSDLTQSMCYPAS